MSMTRWQIKIEGSKVAFGGRIDFKKKIPVVLSHRNLRCV